ncbi:MAG: DUF998 domain-containing protein [Chlorobiaceae bacterium]|nr:DUF998 domain-containing protein [Chlorobiaceae bacterium]
MTQPFHIRDVSEYVISYKLLRRAVGVIGVALPIVLVLGKYLFEGPGIQDSISGYYYTVMRDVFVGSLWAIAIFLMAYKGPQKKDDFCGNLACICAIGVALFPTSPGPDATGQQALIGKFHLLFAGGFFSTLAYFCIVLFCKTDQNRQPTSRKFLRNRIYKICGCLIIGCIILIGVFKSLLQESPVRNLEPVFWLESLAIWSFGWSWFTKGEGIGFVNDI